MATESNVRQSADGVRTYRGRTLEEILPQIREELGADAMILREREGLVGGVGGFFAQRFIEVEARRGEGQSIDIYDEDDLDPASVMDAAVTEQGLVAAGDDRGDDLEPGGQRQIAAELPVERSRPQPFVPPAVQRERIIPREPEDAPESQPAVAPTRSFETDVFLERLRAASQILPDADDEELVYPGTAAPSPTPATETHTDSEPPTGDEDGEAIGPRRSQRRTPAERKPRGSRTGGQPSARPRPTPRAKPETTASAPIPPGSTPETTDAWSQAMAALVAEPASAPSPPLRPSVARPAPPRSASPPEAARPAATPPGNAGYEAVRRRPPSLRSGLPTGPQGVPGSGSVAPSGQTSVRVPSAAPVVPLELRGRREGALRSVISRLLGGRFAASTMPKPSPPRPIDAAAAEAVARKLAARGASEGWIAQLITTAGAHGVPLADGLETAVQAEIARRIVAAPSLPVTGAAVAFIGAGGSGKTRCTAAMASAYSRASTLGVTVITIDGRGGERELKRLLNGEGVPVLAARDEQAQRAVTAARDTGFVIVDTPATTPTDPGAIESLAASLAPLELDGIYVTLPATLGPQAARRVLASFGRLDPTAVAITHADETDQLAVVVEIAISHRIPLGYFHSGTDHLNALSAVEAAELAQQLLET